MDVGMGVGMGMSVGVGVGVGMSGLMCGLVVVRMRMRVRVSVAATGELEHEEGRARHHEQAADDQILVAHDGGAQAESDGDQQRAEHEGERHVRSGGGEGAAHRAAQRLATGTAEHRERGPVVGQDGVAEADARGGEQQRWSGVHASTLATVFACVKMRS